MCAANVDSQLFQLAHKSFLSCFVGRVPVEQIPRWCAASSIHDWAADGISRVFRAVQVLQCFQIDW